MNTDENILTAGSAKNAEAQRFNISLLQSLATGVPGYVRAREEFAYDATSAFEALQIFMKVNEQRFSEPKSVLLAIVISPNPTHLLDSAAFALK